MQDCRQNVKAGGQDRVGRNVTGPQSGYLKVYAGRLPKVPRKINYIPTNCAETIEHPYVKGRMYTITS